MDDINLTSYDLAPLCSLCGGSFGKASETGHPADQDDRHWSQIARGIRGHKSSSDAQVAPLTGRCIQNGRFLGPSLDETADPFVQGPPRQYELTMRSPGETTYGVHDLCWQLLLRRVEALGTPVVLPELVALWLFQLFAALPYSPRGGLITHHGYFGASNERKQSINRLDIGIDYPTQAQPRKDLKKADPMFLPENTLARSHNSSDLFSRLPYEILCLIFPLLSSKDVSHSRLASRSFAIHATPSSLPLSFWTTRFSHDGEMGFLGMQEMPESGIDCCRLYRHYRRLLDASPGDRGFQNRRRIWRCLEPFATTLAAILRFDMIHPIQVSVPTRGQVVIGIKASCYQASAVDGMLQFGAKASRIQKLLLPNSPCGAILKVFTLPFEGRTYVCGLQLLEPDVEHGATQEIGLTFPTCTSTIHLNPNASIVRVDVQLSLDGIHGLLFYTLEPGRCVEKHPAGAIIPQNCYTAVAVLEPYGTLSGFVFEFDTFKALSIRLIETSTPNCAIIQPKLWDIHNPPPAADILRSPKIPVAGRGMIINCYAPFGGNDGSRLSSLIRITALLDSAAGLYGIAFSYNDGSEFLYGLNNTTHELGQTTPCIEQSFFINGPGGERITGLRYTTAVSPHVGYRCIVSMEILTQFNRHYMFRGFDNKGYDNIQQTAVNLRTNHTPTALIIELAAPLWCCGALYVESSVSLPQTSKQLMGMTPNANITQKHTDNAPWMIRERGSSLTSASLSTLRRIRVSAGREGRSCSAEHISGLWFEYSNESNDTIVGQWLDEIGSFVLETDENLVELTVHGRQSSKPVGSSAWQEFRAWRGIKVVGLDFQTSTGRRQRFHLKPNQVDAEREICLAYCATPYEEMDTITWASNFRADDIQVSFKPGKLLGQGHLLLCEAAASIRHPCLSLQQTRRFFNYDNADPEPMNPLKKTGIYGAMRRYYHASEIFLWRERSPDNGELVSMTKVDILYDRGTDGVRGIRFTYEGGFKKEFGLMNGDTYTLELTQQQDERISLLVARRITDGHYGMELHTTAGQVCRAMPSGKEDYEVDSYAMIPGAKPPKIIGETQWRKTHWSFPDSNPTGEGVSHSVGIWVSGEKVRLTNTKGTVREVPFLDAFGPIYIVDLDARSSRFRLGLTVREKIHNATQGGGWTFR